MEEPCQNCGSTADRHESVQHGRGQLWEMFCYCSECGVETDVYEIDF